MSGSPETATAPPEDPGGRRVALVVAVTDYVDASLRRLRAPAGDAADLRDLLADPEIGGFSVTSVINEKAQQIRLAIEDFLAERSPDDVLLVYLSCHGLVDLRRRLYFAARDTIKNRLAASGVEAHWLLEQLEDCRARRQVVILDCCFSGAFAQGAKGDDDLGIGERLVGEGRGRVVLTASRGTEYSFEGEPVHGEDAARGSVFTGALVDGIRTGAADADQDGYISVDDAYTYAFDKVRESGTHQTPQRWLYGAEGSILLAHTPPPVKELAPPPRAGPLATPEPATAEPAVSEPAVSEPPSAAAALDQPSSGPARRRLPTRAVVSAVAAVLLLGGAVLLGVLLAPGHPSGSAGGGSGSGTGTGTSSGRLTATAPWRIVIRDNIEGNDVGCDVTVTNTRSGDQRAWTGQYGAFTSYQMHDSGSFRYGVNNPGCLVVQHSGAGSVTLPFSWKPGTGDTDAFRTTGPVQVTVLDFAGNSSCDPELHAVKDGRILDYGTVEKGGGPLSLEPQGETLVYVAEPYCGLRMTAAP
jgi:hypothetical protein